MNIEQISETSDFDLSFTVEGKVYETSRLLYDIGADAPYSCGTRVFEAEGKGTKEIRVIKDRWMEDRVEEEVEYMTAHKIKMAMGPDTFATHFVDIVGHQRTDPTGGFLNVHKMLKENRFSLRGGYEGLVWDREHTIHPRFRYQVVYKEKGQSLYQVTSLKEVFKHLYHVTAST